ncbi:MAG TPA: putative toxin-antitoxin system toxin component, PIN family [Gaiellaceae bacterium]|nr:putative toxin-antitoxin system toxin component, PIN family [Gaiellaceae bacterium]
MRALLDVNVLVAALLSRGGAPALLVRRWLDGDFELVVSDLLLSELQRTLARPKIRRRLAADEADEFLALLRSGLADRVEDPGVPPATRSSDPNDDYLIAAAAAAHATLVSGDSHLLSLGGVIPVLSPREFLDSLT